MHYALSIRLVFCKHARLTVVLRSRQLLRNNIIGISKERGLIERSISLDGG
jgi:hypothetical protein